MIDNINIMRYLSLSTNNYWISLIVALFITIIILIIFEKYLFIRIYKLLKKTPGKINILERLWIANKRPISLITFVTVAYIILLQFPFTIIEIKKIDLFFQTIITAIIIYSINEFLNTFKQIKYLKEFNEEKISKELNTNYYTNYFIRLIQLTIIGVGLYIILGIWGIDVSSVITALGFISVAIAFSLRDTFSNIFSGIVIVIEQTFKIGDYIENEKIEGTIENIGFRSTKVKTIDKEEILVPNSVLTNMPLNNKTNAEMKKITIYVSIKYDMNKDFKKLILEEFNKNKNENLLNCQKIFFKQDYLCYKLFEFTDVDGSKIVEWKQDYLTEVINFTIKNGFEAQYIGFNEILPETNFNEK